MKQPSNQMNRRTLAGGLNPVSLLLPPATVTVLMWLSGTGEASAVAGLCAYLILQMAWGSYLLWKYQNRRGLPVFAMVASVYWVYFAVELFWGERNMIVTRNIGVPEDSITKAMEMALLGVISMFAGMKIPIRGPAVTATRLPDIDEQSKTTFGYIGLLIALGAAASLFPGVYSVGVGGRQIFAILTTTVPSVGFALLLRRFLTNPSSGGRTMVIGIGAIQIVSALSSGWLGPLVNLGLTCLALITVVRRRVPWTTILITCATIMFLQVGKQAFRNEFWGGGMGLHDTDSSTVLDRAEFWVQRSADQWSEAFRPGGETRSTDLAAKTSQRASLLLQVAHVLEMCPSQVPYQNGQTYYYLLVTLVPRFLWPDKPSVSEANQFYQLAFGITDVKALATTSISVGSMAEGYINFGWFGVIGIMMFIGIVLRIYERTFVANQSNTLLLAIGSALLPGFLAIEGQLAPYLGGVVQQVILSFLVFLPITKHRPVFLSAGFGEKVPVIRCRPAQR
jgi:hypothetical protein